MKTFRTLCSGGELFGVGARAAGWQHLDGYELEAPIAAVACLNGFDVRVADVCAIDYASLAPVDHLHASPSCKSASQANTQAGETEGDKAVAAAICWAIAAHQGRTFSLENVWGYRNFESFARILSALHACGFTVDYRHINAADYGVPQTRKRLILRAVRGARVPPLHPTHRKGGDMFHQPWVGWYAAIADILHTLPPTEPAPWQLARLPAELRETMLFAQNNSQDHQGNSYGATGRAADEPALSMTGASAGWWKAFLMGDQSAGAGVGDLHADASAPAFTLRASDHNAPLRAYLVESKNANQEYGDGLRALPSPATTVITDHKPSHQPMALLLAGVKSPHGSGLVSRTDDEPATTVVSADEGRIVTRAFLMDGDNGRVESGEPTLRAHDEPAMTMRGTRSSPHRAYVGRWVRMTVQALGRFQTVPDSYIGLTPQINGNGVACLLAQRIMESLAHA